MISGGIVFSYRKVLTKTGNYHDERRSGRDNGEYFDINKMLHALFLKKNAARFIRRRLV
jgi:hypothetical protein